MSNRQHGVCPDCGASICPDCGGTVGREGVSYGSNDPTTRIEPSRMSFDRTKPHASRIEPCRKQFERKANYSQIQRPTLGSLPISGKQINAEMIKTALWDSKMTPVWNGKYIQYWSYLLWHAVRFNPFYKCISPNDSGEECNYDFTLMPDLEARRIEKDPQWSSIGSLETFIRKEWRTPTHLAESLAHHYATRFPGGEVYMNEPIPGVVYFSPDDVCAANKLACLYYYLDGKDGRGWGNLNHHNRLGMYVQAGPAYPGQKC